MAMTNRRDELLDDWLVLHCQQGSTEAFERLIERWQGRLWRHAYRLTGRSEAAWDVVQEAWLSITRGIVRLQEPAAFGRWAFTIVTREAASWQRRRGRLETIASLDAPGLDVHSSETGSKSSSASDARSLLREAFHHLRSDRQAILSLHYLEGFEVREIARILGIPEGTAKSRLHHARAELRVIVERIDSNE
ncbi:MAG: RNA polymerase sigma factor [Planctomycetota bacterium]